MKHAHDGANDSYRPNPNDLIDSIILKLSPFGYFISTEQDQIFILVSETCLVSKLNHSLIKRLLLLHQIKFKVKSLLQSSH